jgi:hypothetical protein
MVPKNMVKQGIKANNRNKGANDLKQSAVSAPRSSTILATAVPTLVQSGTRPNLMTVEDAPGKVRTIKKWCIDRTPVYASPNEMRPSTHLYKGAVVELTGQIESAFSQEIKTSWTQIVYKSYNSRAGMQWFTAWVNDVYLDDYNEKFPHSGVVIRSETADPTDAQQYMNLEGKTRYNMCGPLCVAFLVEDDIDSVLTKWSSNSPISYKKVLAGGKDFGTLESDLRKMLGAVLGAYGYGADDDQLVAFREKLTFPVSPTNMVQDLQKMLITHSLIVLVTIDKSGQLIGNNETPQIQHWVVLDKITRNGNRLEIYNPFPNRREECSFNEFYRSCRASWSGIWVKRKAPDQSRGLFMEVLPKFEVTIEDPNPTYKAAQYLDIDKQKKTNLCGEFCVAFLVKDSIENVLKRWNEMQPKLYRASVGVDKGTGTFDLSTILRIYGYNNEGDIIEFAEGLRDPYLKRFLRSPGRMAKILENHFLIAGVNIDRFTGKLKPGNEVRHWVVVDKITPVGNNGGWVELYNPFQNRWEAYSYREFENSVGVSQWAGLWVKRKIDPKFEEQTVADPKDDARQVHSDSPARRSLPGQWTETQMLLVFRQQSQKGISINKIAADLEEKSGWKKQEILDFIRKSTQSSGAGKWTQTRLTAEIQKKRSEHKQPHKIAAELAEVSGWKRQEILVLIRQTAKAGGGER